MKTIETSDRRGRELRTATPSGLSALLLTRAYTALGRVPRATTVAGLCALALAVRLLIASKTHGSNDIDTWSHFARLVLDNGVLKTYSLDSQFNHPPLMGWYAAAMQTIATKLNLQFAFVFKIVPILASIVTIIMVQRMSQLRLFWLILFAFNPTDVLLSAYHGNSDTLCVALCVASVLFADRDHVWASGFALGAALNVKLIPVVLIAPLLFSFRDRKMLTFGAALALCAVPFVPVALGAWDSFRQNAIQYNSSPTPWGVGLIQRMLDGRLQSFAKGFAALALALGKPLILSASVLLGLIQLRFRLFSRAALCALSYGVFLVLAPGFGVQYVIYPIAFLALIPGTLGFQYIYLAGLFSSLAYYCFWTGQMPAFSDFSHDYDLRTILAGCFAWLWLVRYLARTTAVVVARIRRV